MNQNVGERKEKQTHEQNLTLLRRKNCAEKLVTEAVEL